MKNKVIGILLLMPLLLIAIVFSVVETFGGVNDADRIILNHDPLNAIRLGEIKEISYTVLPEKYKDDVVVVSSDESVVEVIEPILEGETWRIRGVGEGEVQITASLYFEESIIEDNVSFYAYSENTNKILVYDVNDHVNFIEEERKYGEYDFDKNFNKTNAKFNIRTLDVTGVNDKNSAPSEVCKVSDITDNLTIRQDPFTFVYEVTILDEIGSNNESYIEFETMKEGYSTKEKFFVDIVKDGVNVHNYDDLMHCTNFSNEGEIVVLQVNLESAANTFMNFDPTKPNKIIDVEAFKYRNSELFGKVKVVNGKNIYYMDDYKTMKSTYDTTYINFINDTYGLNISTDIKVGVELKKDLYGNGYAINMHSLTFPTGEGTHTSEGVTNIYPQDTDPFQGALDFISATLGEITSDPESYKPLASVAGQDNIGLLIKGDDIKISNVEIKSCNNVNHLSNLQFVGTTVEVMGDNVEIVNCLLQNGRNVLRSFSNENLLVKNSLLRYARDFIIKVGSNTNYFSKEVGDFPTWTGEECYDNEITLDNVYTSNSGFFSVGIEAHFNGDSLINGDPMFLGEAKLLGATSKGTKLNILNNTKFYDWKDYTELDSSTIIQLSKNIDESFKDALLGDFDLAKMIRKALEGENEKFIYTVEEPIIDEDGKVVTENDEIQYEKVEYIHGGIAFYGGGKNYSTILNSDEEIANYELSLLDKITMTGLLATFSGKEPFKFLMYENTASITPLDSPSINDLREYYYENKESF